MRKIPKGQIAKRVVFNPMGKNIVEPLGPDKMPVVRCGLYSHCCYEWNEMLIDETDPEFEACNCGKPNPRS